ncbi:TRAPP trafficking subunit Trs65-domain-containing protein [Lipomyces chichibuensis]|uniref:TRAPP trafficking subunit Trs65-domain-containing protein n=1 Tax=Lipomyces chichibuensis TaxID=1546026 RepID=UPI0033442C4E
MTSAATVQRSSLDLFSSGGLVIHVPDVATYLKEHPTQSSTPNDATYHSKIFDLPKRSLIFYDEKIPVYVQLRLTAPDLSSIAFNAYLSRLVLTVDATAISLTNTRYSSLGLQIHGQQPVPEHQEASYPIFSTVIDRSSLVVVQEPNESSEGEDIWTALWHLTVPITRPKARLVSPRISLAARANLRKKSNDTISIWKANTIAGTEEAPVEYLSSLTPLNSLNILEGLAHDTLYTGNPPILGTNKVLPPTLPITATSVSQVASASAAPEFIRLPRLVCKTYTPVFPCISLRLRCSRLPRATTLSEDEFIVLANVDVDVTAFAKVDVVILKVELVVTGGKTEHVTAAGVPTEGFGARFPMKCSPLDGISEIFKLYPLSVQSNIGSNRNSGANIAGHGGGVDLGDGYTQSASSASAKNLTRSITVKVEYSPVLKQLNEGDSVLGYGPDIVTVWNTTVDFSASGSGSSGPPQQMAEQNRNGQMVQPITGFRSVSGRSSSAWLQMQQQQQQQLRSPSGTLISESPMLTGGPWGINHPQPPSTASAFREIVHEGLSLTFSGPTEVLAGQVFVWKVYIINRSRTAKRISLIVQPKTRKMNNVKVLPRSPLSQQTAQHQNASLSTIILDDTVLYKVHRTDMIESDELISLVNDIRMGPLGPGASHETELKLVALGVGVLSLDGVRVVDLAKGEGFECTNLMNVICRRG